MSNPLNTPEEPPGDLEEKSVHESGFYGVLPGIAGLLLGLSLILFMFALADGFA